MKYELAIFDLDGTLIETAEDLGEAANHALRSAGLPLHDITDYRRMVGHGVRNLMISALPEVPAAPRRDGERSFRRDSDRGPRRDSDRGGFRRDRR